jgi:hypothetical protein
MRRRILLISFSEGIAWGPRPVVNGVGGEQPFPVAQQIIKVCLQVG